MIPRWCRCESARASCATYRTTISSERPRRIVRSSAPYSNASEHEPPACHSESARARCGCRSAALRRYSAASRAAGPHLRATSCPVNRSIAR